MAAADVGGVAFLAFRALRESIKKLRFPWDLNGNFHGNYITLMLTYDLKMHPE